MIRSKKLGIWMDHSIAHLMECCPRTMTTTIIKSDFTHQIEQSSFDKSENLMHNKEQQMQASYFKKIAAVIKQFDEVLLFGPTEAKLELKNMLDDDHHFDKIKLGIHPADKMTEMQERLFVREYFAQVTSLKAM
jgi:predicted lipid carrier protein YhbT